MINFSRMHTPISYNITDLCVIIAKQYAAVANLKNKIFPSKEKVCKKLLDQVKVAEAVVD